ncbi:hypothetical protein QTG54_004379 [Skeletonema marinoi]|uniref:Uncharacterized protein n=1 Tax=Skeletonema marinoi TaxID=267567 RepID=A0AAD8YEX5_9STRA|nr:hypothetical protein QTG54_004379 [Skeletonema marinoi]
MITVKPPSNLGREDFKRSSTVADRPKIKSVVNDESTSRSNSNVPPQKTSIEHFLSIQGASLDTKNSEIYQPIKTGKRLLTYKRFGGRLNNQLFQFITALQHAKVLKRTLVVPDEVREVDWTGMFDTAYGFGILIA